MFIILHNYYVELCSNNLFIHDKNKMLVLFDISVIKWTDKIIK